MKAMEYHMFDVVFVIEGTASCGVYLNEMKTNYIIPALEFFSQGQEDIYSPSNKSASSLFGIVTFKTSQCIPNNTCNSFGPFITKSDFLKTIDNLDLTGGKSECNANLAEGLATALVCFQDLEKIRDADSETTKQQHCVLISNSSPYSMPVFECSEYEGRSVEQLATIFLERNINLSIISPRKIPVLFELFEKAGGDLVLTTSKNYSKDPRHLVLLKGFSLKERPASPNMTQQTQIVPTQQIVANSVATSISQNNEQQQQQQQQQQPMVNSLPMNASAGLRPLNPGVRQNTPIMQGTNQNQAMATMNIPPPPFGNNQPMGNFSSRVANPQSQQQTNQQQQRWMPNAGQPRQAFMGQGNIQGSMIPGNMNQTNMMPQNQPSQAQPQQNSALISQLTQPPNINTMTPQQAAMARMAAMQNQQQNQQMLNQTNNNMNMVPNTMQNNSQIMVGNQQSNIQVGMGQQNQSAQQAVQQMNPQQSQQQGMAPGLPHRERIWRGTLEWNDKQNQQSTIRQVQCEIYASISKETNEVEVRGENWPSRLIMQLMPRAVITNVGGQMLRDAKIVNFQWGQPSESFESLSKVMANGFAGCVHFNASTQCDVKILILLYMPDKKSYYGFIPNDQNGYVDRLRRVIQQSKMTQFGQNPGMQQVQQNVTRPQMMNPITQQNVIPQVSTPQNANNMQGQGDQSMMFNQQMQMQGAPNMVANQPMNQQRPNMTRPNMMPNNLRHLLQQQQQNQNQFRPQISGSQQMQQAQQMHGNIENFDLF